MHAFRVLAPPKVQPTTTFDVSLGESVYLPTGVLWQVINVGVVPTCFAISGVSSVATAASGQLHRMADHIESMIEIDAVMQSPKGPAIQQTYFINAGSPRSDA